MNPKRNMTIIIRNMHETLVFHTLHKQVMTPYVIVGLVQIGCCVWLFIL